MMRVLRLVLGVVLGMATASAWAGAREVDPAAHALVVGSNEPGSGQARLRYAETDARQVAELLTDLGGVPRGQVQVVLRPTRAALLSALDALGRRVAEDLEAGRTPRVFFYYSGHARASALVLGAEELPLAELRDKLTGLRAGLAVVVLDACQSGAFSRVKGAEPAADFSFNSLARLSATGVAVLASSSASELSQESERLRSSYFTHHLLVGMRGAGDTSRDGRVSLDEAYRYAYHQTLLATAATAVGAQHVSLEVELEGQGEVPLTWPLAADAQLELPAPLEAEVLVERRLAGAVVAEVHKSRGAPVRIGLPAGDYRVLVRAPRADHLRRCDLSLPRGGAALLAPDRCERVSLAQDGAKGGFAGARLAVEIGFGPALLRESEFTRRLEAFGYEKEASLFPHGHLAVAGIVHLLPEAAAVLELADIGGDTFARNTDTTQTYEWSTTILGLYARGRLPLAGGIFAPYAQAGGGVATASTSLTNPAGSPDRERHWGYHLDAAAGLEFMPFLPSQIEGLRHFGAFLQVSYTTAPVIENLIGDTHDGGGTFIRLGLRGTL